MLRTVRAGAGHRRAGSPAVGAGPAGAPDPRGTALGQRTVLSHPRSSRGPGRPHRHDRRPSWLLRRAGPAARGGDGRAARDRAGSRPGARRVGRARGALDAAAGRAGWPTGGVAEPEPGLALVRRIELAAEPRLRARRARTFAGQTLRALVAADPGAQRAPSTSPASWSRTPPRTAAARSCWRWSAVAGNLLVRAWDDGPGTPRVLPYRPGLSEQGARAAPGQAAQHPLGRRRRRRRQVGLGAGAAPRGAVAGQADSATSSSATSTRPRRRPRGALRAVPGPPETARRAPDLLRASVRELSRRSSPGVG